MLYDYLAEFAVVAREKSLARAARELSLSEATLSRHMRALETDLGAELLDRRNNGSELTEQGRYVYRYAADMVDSLNEMAHGLRDVEADDPIVVCGLLRSPLYVGALRAAFVRHVPGFVESRLRFVRHEGETGSQEIGRLLSGEIALFVTFPSSSALKRLRGLVESYAVAELFHPRLVACMAASNPLASRKVLSPRDLEGAALLHTWSNDLQARSLWEATSEELRRHGVRFQPKNTGWEAESGFSNSENDEGIFLLPEKHQVVDLHASYGRAVVPVEGMHLTLVGCFARDNAAVSWLGEPGVARELEATLAALG